MRFWKWNFTAVIFGPKRNKDEMCKIVDLSLLNISLTIEQCLNVFDSYQHSV